MTEGALLHISTKMTARDIIAEVARLRKVEEIVEGVVRRDLTPTDEDGCQLIYEYLLRYDEDRIVSMDPLSVQDHYRILLKYVDSIKHRTGTNVTIDPFVLQQIAASAVKISLGARWAIHRVNAIIDDMVYDNPFETNYVYLATNERTVI